jgi:hypothetical protein
MATINFDLAVNGITNADIEDEQTLMAKIEKTLKTAGIEAEIVDTLDSEMDDEENE